MIIYAYPYGGIFNEVEFNEVEFNEVEFNEVE